MGHLAASVPVMEEAPPVGSVNREAEGRRWVAAGPEVTCEECFANLDVYVEHELEGDDADALVPGMRAHLEGCPACAEEHDSLRDLIASQTGGRT